MRRAAAAAAAALRGAASAIRHAGSSAAAEFPRHPSELSAAWLTAALTEAGRIPHGATVRCVAGAARRTARIAPQAHRPDSQLAACALQGVQGRADRRRSGPRVAAPPPDGRRGAARGLGRAARAHQRRRQVRAHRQRGSPPYETARSSCRETAQCCSCLCADAPRRRRWRWLPGWAPSGVSAGSTPRWPPRRRQCALPRRRAVLPRLPRCLRRPPGSRSTTPPVAARACCSRT